MPENFSLCQQVFTLSVKANWLMRLNNNAPDTKANLERQLYQHLTQDFLPSQVDSLGAWDVAWGPGIFSTMGIPDNLVYVARKSDGSAYVVAVAGTNGASTFGWQDEDGQVKTTVAWTQAFQEDLDGRPLLTGYGNPDSSPNPCLSTGTAIGVRCLLSIRPDPNTNPHDKQGIRLIDYLKNAASKDATLVIAGHSLGGALSPVLALALFNPNGGPLKISDWQNVYTLPSAGATPGNKDFADCFKSVFPGIPVDPGHNPDPHTTDLWNRNIANTKDFVPLAWVPKELQRIDPTARDTLYPHLRWRSLKAKEALVKLIPRIIQQSTTGADSTPFGSSQKAGDYAPIPSILWDCEEIEPRAAIKYLIPPDKDHAKESFAGHWGLQHAQAYAEQIFKIQYSVSPIHLNEMVSSVWLSLLDVPVDEDESLAIGDTPSVEGA